VFYGYIIFNFITILITEFVVLFFRLTVERCWFAYFLLSTVEFVEQFFQILCDVMLLQDNRTVYGNTPSNDSCR
jgi:hypothetical protein